MCTSDDLCRGRGTNTRASDNEAVTQPPQQSSESVEFRRAKNMTGRTGEASANVRATSGLQPAALVAIYIAVGLTPLMLAQVQGLPSRGFWREVSSGLVMVGFAMLLAEFLLSGRFGRLSGKAGIDLTMRFHQLAATSILAFVIVHPFLYAVPRLSPDPADAVSSLQRMFTSNGLRSGVVAWSLLILFVALAIFRERLPVRYEIWRASHGLGAALIAGLSAHHTLRAGTYSADPVLAGFWLAMTGGALVSLAYVYVIKPFLQVRAPYRLVSNDKVADGMWRATIEPERADGFCFAAGQFAWVNFGHSPFSLTEHPFSISSSPAARPRIEFTIKESGDFTNRIGKLPIGTTVYLDGPHGAFTHSGREQGPLVLIAGGVGLAPIIGILRQLRIEGWPYPITLIYGNRAASQILYRDEIEAMADALDFSAYLALSEPPDGWHGLVGELTKDVLTSCLDDPLDPRALYFICGPTPMMDSVEGALVALGVPPARIVSERFKYD